MQEKQKKFDEMKKAGLDVPANPEDIGSTDDEYYDANEGQEEEEEEEEE